MSTVTDSQIFRNIFSTSPSSEIWSDKTRTTYYLQFESALAVAQARLGIIPTKAADAIKEKCKIELIDMEELRKDTERIGYPVLGVVKQLVGLVNKVEPGLGEWAHWGATTQQAVPISFGFKLARLLATFHRHQQRLSEILPRLLVLEFSGAAGTLATLCTESTTPEVILQVQEEMAQELDLNVPEIAWHTERDRIAEIGSLFALIAGTCSKFALDIKLLMQTEVGEVYEPYYPHRGSSSTMPQKRNPIASVYITAMSSTVRQLSAALLDAMVEDHERSTGPWEIEWIVLPQICTMTHAILMHTQSVVEGLEVDTERMKNNLLLTRGAVVSEAVMMGLGKVIGRQVAHDLVYDLCRKAIQEDRPLVDLLEESDEVMNAGMERTELEKLCDPGNYLGLSEMMVKRVLTIPSQHQVAEVLI
ncbi:hypothetical protein VNI00_006205 [Paramarasmius palmivorus]|uniref:Adenylosuccinate lyase C-terminal domain-containing protein n=1 Tax=Paramarasmius palmivorus TaxID=297713 RepID=A0AAW0DBG1_9AGAR